ncbi:MAG: DNA primase [Patescibacteria group bacterium]|jgi:DNA primase|nr:DNA primase [Patescibacteria group bacterium]
MPEVTDQIKERLGVAEVIGEYLKLDKAGSNYKALCPFHNEKTPSFMVNTEKNFWYCFGCQKGGDVFSFVMEMEGLEFREVLERLAERTGVEIPRFQKLDKKEKGRKQRLFEILEWATKFYQHQLYQSKGAEKIIEYLKKRGINDEQIANFRIGFAPNGWRNLLNFLLQKGYNLNDINATGLLVEKNGSQENFYDRFRNRIIFPVIDISGRTVGYSARIVPGEDEKSAKYVNTSQTEIYDKSRILYGLYQAKTEIKKQNFAIVVEGNVDVISSFVVGVPNIIAISGTALTAEHAKIIKRYTEKVKLCFDMDEAGQNAMRKSVKTCLEEGLEVEIIIMPEGVKDVNDLLVENRGEEWKELTEKSRDVLDYLFESVSSKYDKNKPSGKKKIAHDLLNVIKDIADPIEQNYWLKKLSNLVEVGEEQLTQVLEKVNVKESISEKKEVNSNVKDLHSSEKSKSRIEILQERLLGVFSLGLNELSGEAEKIGKDFFEEKYQEIWEALKRKEKSLFEEDLNRFETAVCYSFDKKEGFIENEIDFQKECKMLIDEITKEKNRRKLKKITWDIKRAQELGDEDTEDLLLREFQSLSSNENDREG